MATVTDEMPRATGYAALTSRRYLAIGIAVALLLGSLAVDIGTGPGGYP